MRWATLATATLLLAGWSLGVVAWEKEDHELFDLVGALEAAEGKATTFYTFLNITKSATTSEINKAARRRSLELHPDKNPGVKNGQERFTRLGLIAAILRDKEKRERYNFFHDNGVPKWKGTGYMYSRWQPGIGFALSFILLVTTLTQFAIQHVTFQLDLKRIEKFQRAAFLAANGPKKDQVVNDNAARKKVKVALSSINNSSQENEDGEEPSSASSSRATRRRNGAAAVGSSPTVTMMVEGNQVWIVTETGDEIPLDASAASKPSLKTTFIPNLVSSLISKVLPNKPAVEPTNGADTEADETEGESSSTPIAKTSLSTKSGARKRKGKGKN